MTRLIDADALLEKLKSEFAFLSHDDYVYEITNAPTVQSEGWVSVPIEPTGDMFKNAHMNSEIGDYIASNWADAYGCFTEFYKAMIQAAPTNKE